jgi:hypothetical protein
MSYYRMTFRNLKTDKIVIVYEHGQSTEGAVEAAISQIGPHLLVSQELQKGVCKPKAKTQTKTKAKEPVKSKLRMGLKKLWKLREKAVSK